MFIPEASFEMLVCQQVSKLEPICHECASLVFEELQRIVSQIEAQVSKGHLTS